MNDDASSQTMPTTTIAPTPVSPATGTTPTTAEAQRLLAALEAAGFEAAVTLSDGTSGVASPSRLATEWAGFHVRTTLPPRSFYAKVLYDDMREVIDVGASARASQAAAEAGVAPDVILVDMARGVLMFDALDAAQWRAARVDDLARPDRLAALWDLKRRLHRSASPRNRMGHGKADSLAANSGAVDHTPADSAPDRPVRDIAADLRAMRARCARDGVILPDAAAWIDTCVDLACAALQATTDPAALVPVHGDGVASNVMIDGAGQMRLIDFDRGGDADPWYDVATTLNELFQFEDEWRAGITAWCGQCSESDYARCRLYALIDDWFWTLSASWSGVASRRSLEFTKLGQWTFLRTQQTVLDARFESWLRLLQGIPS